MLYEEWRERNAAAHPQDALVHEGVPSWMNSLELLQTFADTLSEVAYAKQAHLI